MSNKIKLQINAEIAPGLFETVAHLDCHDLDDLWSQIDQNVIPKLIESGLPVRRLDARLNWEHVSLDYLSDRD